MSTNIQAFGTHGLTLYAQVRRNTDSEIWNTSGTPAFEAYATAHIANYVVALTEEGTASGSYVGTFPTAIVAGEYAVVVRQKVGGSVAESDPLVAGGNVAWDGTNIEPAGVAAIAAAHGTGSYMAVSVTVDAVTNQIIVVNGWGQIAAFAGADLIITFIVKDGAGVPINVTGWTWALYGGQRPGHDPATLWSVTSGGSFDTSAASSGTIAVTIDRLVTEDFGGKTHDVDIWRTDLATDETVKAWGQIAFMNPARP